MVIDWENRLADIRKLEGLRQSAEHKAKIKRPLVLHYDELPAIVEALHNVLTAIDPI